MEFQPQSLALRAMVNVDILEFFFVESNIASWAVQYNSSLKLIHRGCFRAAEAYCQDSIVAIESYPWLTKHLLSVMNWTRVLRAGELWCPFF